MYEVTPFDNVYNDSPGASGPGTDSSASTSGSGYGFGSGSGYGSGSGSGSGSNEKCGCPNACFSNLLKSLNEKSKGSPSGGSFTPGSSFKTTAEYSKIVSQNDPNSGINIDDATRFSSALNPIYMRGKGDLRITNEKMDKDKYDAWIKNSNKNVPLDDDVNTFIQSYFGIDKTNPINVGKPLNSKMIPLETGPVEFTNYIATRSLIDQRHVNILIDLVYYFMENIIPGLPTESVPISYVEWRPIIWSSHTFL
jgi:hypothetical protein